MDSVVKQGRVQRQFFYLTCHNKRDGCQNLIRGCRSTRRYCSQKCANRDKQTFLKQAAGGQRACWLCTSIYDAPTNNSWHCQRCKPWVEAKSRQARKIANHAGVEPRIVLWQLYQRRDDAVCDSCGRDFAPGERGLHVRHVDHDHNTGRIRGSLCGACNIIIGMSGESIGQLSLIQNYVERQKVMS